MKKKQIREKLFVYIRNFQKATELSPEEANHIVHDAIRKIRSKKK